MSEIEQQPEHIDWQEVNPLTRTIMAAFSGRIGDNSGELSIDDFQASMGEAFPAIPKPQLATDILPFTAWRARNRIIEHLTFVDPESFRATTDELAERAGGDETARLIANHVFDVCAQHEFSWEEPQRDGEIKIQTVTRHGTRERHEATPILKILSRMAVDRA